ncbi:MAG TPA: VOC family protein [Planococcus sp. (in: firmicutes)]|nr:VOC family protein [Planococcus sp. (in: firmicutes)]
MNFHQKPVTHISQVGLKVLDLKGMAEFYQKTIGLQIIAETEDSVSLGAGGNVLLKLHSADNLEPKLARFAGLYHFAILLPNRKELGKVLLHLHAQGIRLGSSDHLVSEALYLSDPEGNGIEIYRDRDPEEWTWRNGEVAMAVDPIDAKEILGEAERAGEKWEGMPETALMGHIHLHVSDLNEAQRFYQDVLGFEVVASMGGQALFLSDQKYHHHIALNIWNGAGIPPLPEKTAGLSYYTIVLGDGEKLLGLKERLVSEGQKVREKEGFLEIKDPSGNIIRLRG